MWDRQIYPGYISVPEYSRLAGIHMLFILMFFILVITLWIRLFDRSSSANGYSVLSSIAFLICVNTSLFYSFPKYGDDGIEGSLFVLVAFFFADLILIVTILIFMVVSLIKHTPDESNIIKSSEIEILED